MGSEKGSLKGKIFVLRWWIIPFACYFHSESSHCSHSRNRTGLTKSLSLSYLLIVLIFSVSLLCCYLLLVSPYEVGSRSNSSFHYFSSRTNFVIMLLLHGHLGGKDNICFLNTGHLVDISIQILFTWWWRSLLFRFGSLFFGPCSFCESRATYWSILIMHADKSSYIDNLLCMLTSISDAKFAVGFR